MSNTTIDVQVDKLAPLIQFVLFRYGDTALSFAEQGDFVVQIRLPNEDMWRSCVDFACGYDARKAEDIRQFREKTGNE